MAVVITVTPTNGVGEEQNAATSEPSRPYQIEGNRGLVPLMRAMFPCWFRMLGPNHPFMERVRCKGVDSLKDALKEKLTTMGVVSALLLTMTFSAGLAPPPLSYLWTQVYVVLMSASTLCSISSVLASVWVFDLLNVVLHTDEDITTFARLNVGQQAFDTAQALSVGATVFAALGYALGVSANVHPATVAVIAAASGGMLVFLYLQLGGGFDVAFTIVKQRRRRRKAEEAAAAAAGAAPADTPVGKEGAALV